MSPHLTIRDKVIVLEGVGCGDDGRAAVVPHLADLWTGTVAGHAVRVWAQAYTGQGHDLPLHHQGHHLIGGE